MSFCGKCGLKIDAGIAYCPRCGASAAGSPSKENLKREPARVSRADARKCPQCGEGLPAFVLNCPCCGFKLNRRRPVRSISELSRRLDEIESERPLEVKRKGLFSRASSNEDRYHVVSPTDQRKVTLIKSFPIPNTKEDLVEFVLLASTNVDPKALSGTSGAMASEKVVSDAWYSKLCQAYEKARIVLAGDPCLDALQKRYEATVAAVDKSRRAEWRALAIFGLALLLTIVALLAASGIKQAYRSSLSPEERLEYDIDQEEKECEAGETRIFSYIKNGQYSSARDYAYALDFDESLSSDRHKYWEKRKAELLQTISDAENGRSIKVDE